MTDIIAHHLVISAYGFWLPNDPRGSWSSFVGSPALYAFGPATKTDEKRSLAAEPHDRERRLASKQVLRYPPVIFSTEQIQAVAGGFGDYVRTSGLVVRACSVMPDHAHFVIDEFRLQMETVSNMLKGAATKALNRAGVHPFARYTTPGQRVPKCWAEGQWDRWIQDEADLRACILYVEENPIKAGLPPQRWPFVTPLP